MIDTMRHYRGFIADSARWRGFEFRDDDIVISTPAKCGTTWMQNIVAMLVLDRTDLDRPITEISPWLDMLTRPRDEVVAMLEAQEHRRFIKTHTPLDGVPEEPQVTYLCVLRHPLQVVQSDVVEASVHRFPVKSMQGESPASVELRRRGRHGRGRRPRHPQRGRAGRDDS